MTKKTFDKYTSHDRYSDDGPFVTLWVETSSSYTREPVSGDEWDAGDKEEELDDFGVSLGVPKNPDRYISRDRALNKEHLGFFPKVGDVVFMVIESFGQGSTFGSEDPCYKPVRVFKTQEEASDWTESDEAEDYKDDGYFGGHNEYLVEEVTVKAGVGVVSPPTKSVDTKKMKR
jgi:hypothetical protein